MKCYDESTGAGYNTHEEYVVSSGPSMVGMGYCVRCGAVTDLETCKRMAARGNPGPQDALRRAGIAYLTEEERKVEAALKRLSPRQREDLIRRV